MFLAVFPEDGVNQLALAHGLVHLDVEFLAGLHKLCLVHPADVHSGILLNRLQNRETAIRRFKIDCLVADGNLSLAVKFEGNFLKHLLDKLHHPDVVLVGHIDFHAGELRVVSLVHSLVAEVLCELIHSRVTADNQPLKVQLVGNSQIERDVERVVMGDERTRSSTARNALEDRGLNLKATGRIEVLAHRRYYLTPLDEDLAHLRIHDEVDIPLSILKFRIRERVENLAVLLFYNREYPQGLAQERKFSGVDGELACLGDEGISLDSYDVADVEELLEDRVVHRLVLAWTNLVTFHIHLNPASLVLQFNERRRAHNPAGHYSSGNADIRKITFLGIIALLYLPCCRIDRIERSRIRLDSEFAKFP